MNVLSAPIGEDRISSRHMYTLNPETKVMADCFMHHYCDVIMGPMASQITSLTIHYSIVHSGEDQRKHRSSASLAFVRGIHRWPVNSPHKMPVTRKIFPFDDVVMIKLNMMPPSNLHDFLWKYKLHASGHFLCKIYWLLALASYAPRSKGKVCIFLIRLNIIVNFMG